MRVVVYTQDFEPITVIKLDQWAVNFLHTTERVALTVIPVLELAPPADDEPIKMETWCVVLQAVWIHAPRRQRAGMVLVVQDEKNALLLRSIFLPGQRRALKDAEDAAFHKGALTMFRSFGDSDD